MLITHVGGGSNAIGLFHPFLDDEGIEIVGVEAAGEGLDTSRHAASLAGGSPGILHGNKTYLLQDDDGQITEAHSIRSEEHTSELQSLMRISYAVFCLKKKKIYQDKISTSYDIRLYTHTAKHN